MTLLARHPANLGCPLNIERGNLFILAAVKSFTDGELSRLKTLRFTVNRDRDRDREPDREHDAVRFDTAGS